MTIKKDFHDSSSLAVTRILFGFHAESQLNQQRMIYFIFVESIILVRILSVLNTVCHICNMWVHMLLGMNIRCNVRKTLTITYSLTQYACGRNMDSTLRFLICLWAC